MAEPIKIHPRKLRGYQSVRTLFHIDNLQNPLPEEVKDSTALNRLFTVFPYIPYATSDHGTSHALLDFNYNLRTLSNTDNACIRSKAMFAFGGKIRLLLSENDEFDTGKEPQYLRGPTFDKQIEAINGVEKFGIGVKKFIKRCHSSYETTGNIWIEVVLTSEGEAKAASIYSHDPRDVLIKVQSDEEKEEGIEFVGVCKDWALAFSTEPVRHVARYPHFSQDDEGVFRTMVHGMHGDAYFYGRPPSEASMASKYSEHKDDIFVLKISNSNFTGQVIYEMEDDGSMADLNKEAQNNGYRNFADQVKKNATNQSDDPDTAIFHTRPTGARPSVLHQIKPNTSEAWHDSTNKRFREKIIISHQWSERLLGLSAPTGFDSKVFLDEAFVKEFTVLADLRNEILEPINQAYNIIFEWIGAMTNVKFEFNSMIDPLLEAIREREGGDDADSPNGGGMKEKVDAYSVGVRSGTITPQQEDETQLRADLGLPPLSQEGVKAWTDDDGVRRPITLKSKTEKDAEIQQIEE